MARAVCGGGVVETLHSQDVTILHELDLGQHTLFLMSDGSMDLLATDEQTPYLADNGLTLTSEETARLLMALHIYIIPST